MIQKKKTEIKVKVVTPSVTVAKKAQKVQKAATISHGVGRRKASVARAWLSHGSGKVSVNGKPHEEYFDTAVMRMGATTPLSIIPSGSQYDIHVVVNGGGKQGQSDAVKLSIARALVELDQALKPDMRKHGLLTVDSRVKERKKYGRKAARRGFQFVKR